MKFSIAILTAVVLLVVLVAIGTVSAADTGTTTDHTIAATGTGSVIGTPDRAQISLAVETEDTDVKAAQAVECGPHDESYGCADHRRDPKRRS